MIGLTTELEVTIHWRLISPFWMQVPGTVGMLGLVGFPIPLQLLMACLSKIKKVFGAEAEYLSLLTIL